MKTTKWIARYLWELVAWSFARWRIHQAIAAVVIAVVLLMLRKSVGISWLNTVPAMIAAYFVIWLLILILVIAPACLWHQQDEKLRPSIAFVDHEDNNALYSNILHFARVTVKNCGAVLLNHVTVLLESIDPRPAGIVTLNVPLKLMHTLNQTSFSLQPEMSKSVDLLEYDVVGPSNAQIHHIVDTVPRDLPPGTYHIKLVASADETRPIKQGFKVEINPANSQILRITREE